MKRRHIYIGKKETNRELMSQQNVVIKDREKRKKRQKEYIFH